MTSVPPEPPAGSPSAPPPDPQQWSAPPPVQPAHPASGGGFNAASVKPMDWGILVAGLLAFIFSFVTYYTYSYGPLSRDFSAWDGFFGWFSTVLVLLSVALLAVHLFAPQVQLRVPVRLLVLGGFALAGLSVIVAGFVDSRDISGSGISSGRGAGYYLSLIVILAGLVLSFLRLRETGSKLPWDKSA